MLPVEALTIVNASRASPVRKTIFIDKYQLVKDIQVLFKKIIVTKIPKN
jgi:hypothetical protein